MYSILQYVACLLIQKVSSKYVNSYTYIFNGYVCLLPGAIVDRTGSHTISFIVAGVLVASSGFMCFPLRRISNWEKRKEELKIAQYKTVPPVPDISMEDLNDV